MLTLYLWIRQEWTDAYLHWDPKAYGDLDAIRIPSSLVWRPDIVLYNKYCLLSALPLKHQIEFLRCLGNLPLRDPLRSSLPVRVTFSRLCQLKLGDL